MCMESAVAPDESKVEAPHSATANGESETIYIYSLNERQKAVICEQSTRALTTEVMIMHEQMLEELPIETLAQRYKIQPPAEEKAYVLNRDEFLCFGPDNKKWKEKIREVLTYDENVDVCNLDEADEQKLQAAIDEIADVMYKKVRQLMQVVVEQSIVFKYVTDDVLCSALSIRSESTLKRICLKVFPKWLEESIFTFAKLKDDDDSADSDDDSSLEASNDSSDEGAEENDSDTSEELESENDSDVESSESEESPSKKQKK